MSASFNTLRSRSEHIAIPTVWVAFALSLMLHALMLWSGWLPRVRLLPFEDFDQKKPGHSLAVRLVPLPGAAPAPPPSPALQAQPAPAHRPRPLMAARQQPSAPRTAPPVLAIERASPSGAAPRPSETPQPAKDDFASLVDARRRAREAAASAPPAPASPPAPRAESERERQERIVAANLGLDRVPTFGADRRQGGGIFQIQRMGYQSAEYVFFGWNKYIKRNANQVIEVTRGANPSMEIAVVRSMIAIIREHEQGNFMWESIRLGREVSLSARLSDTAGLEDFLMQEFFSGAQPR